MDTFESFNLNYIMYNGGNDINKIPLINNNGRIGITVRNVGQGNWNEIKCNDSVRIVYDAGAPMTSSPDEIVNIIGNRSTLYAESKPILILSHWDKDHYHSLLGMSDNDLKNCFSAFVCRNYTPYLTCRILFMRWIT